MKLLYLSCHAVLEYDEVRLFHELGADVFSDGVYADPRNPGDPKRPPIDYPKNEALFPLVTKDSKEHIPQEMIDWADIIFVQHWPDWLVRNWERIRQKRVIWRSIGQSTLNVERILAPMRADGLEIVRYSPRERTIPYYQGEDALIRFYKDPAEWCGWTGEKKRVITFSQSMKDRKDYCGYDVYRRATEGFERAMWGNPSKEADPLYCGLLSYDEMRRELRENGCYLYTGTYPASYTLNFIEAYMTGIPIVAVGRNLGESPYEVGQSTYEVPDFFSQYASGLVADSVEEIHGLINEVLNKSELAKQLSAKARASAIELFGKEKIKEQWRRFLYG